MSRAAHAFQDLLILGTGAAWQCAPGRLLAVQRAMVTGAERVCALAAAEGDAGTLAAAQEYLLAARLALVRLEASEALPDG